MANNYYNVTTTFIPGTKARSDEVNTEYQGIAAAFDLLPTSTAALTTGTATLGTESGSGNGYVLTMPDTRLANADGDEIVFLATHTNTGAATANVDTIGAVPLVRADGSAMEANDIVSGLFYVARYDNTNTRFQLIGPSASYLTNASASAAAAAASETAAGISETNAAASEAAAAISESNSADNVDYAEEWAINPEDTAVSVAAGGDGSTTFSALHWAAKASGASGLPLIVGGDALKYLRVNAGETDYELAAFVSASEGAEGQIELATQAEVDAGSDTTRAVTPATLAAATTTASGLIDTQLFTSGGTWTKPAGATTVEITVIGAGGGGAGATATAPTARVGGAGGAGGANYATILASNLSGTETVTVGTAGTAGAAGNGGGGNGGLSQFSSGSNIVLGNGGSGGSGAVAADTAGNGGSGGTTSSGGNVTNNIKMTGGAGGEGFIETGAARVLIPPGGDVGFGYGVTSHMKEVTASGTAAGQFSRGYGCGGSGSASVRTASGLAGTIGLGGLVIVRSYS